MLDQYGFLGRVFTAFSRCEISVDVIASSEVSLSLTLDKKHRESSENMKKLTRELGEFADVSVLEDRAIISLISNIEKAADVMATTFRVMGK
jgi:aspartate kinase